MATPPVVQSQYCYLSALFGLLWRRNTPQEAQGVSSVTSSSPERAQLRSLAPAAPVDSDISDNECTVCRSAGEEDNDAEMALKTPTEACTHPPQVCIGCLQQVILAAVTSGDFIVGIPCPSYDCPQRMGYHDVQKWAAKEVFDRYDKLLLQDSLRTDGSYVLCVEASCSAGQEHTSADHNDIVTCYHCGTKQCFRHRIPWHEGLTCEQWDEYQRTVANQQEQKTELWTQAGMKTCPRPGCGRRVWKGDGFVITTCKRPGGRGHQFCWECLASYAFGDNHYENCRYCRDCLGKNSAPISRRPIPGPSINQRPSVLTSLPSVMLGGPAGITQEFGEDEATQTRHNSVKALKLYRERKMQYEAELLVLQKVLQQERINQLEAQLALEREKLIASWPLNQEFLGPGPQHPPFTQIQTYVLPGPQTGLYGRRGSHTFGTLHATFIQSASTASTLFQDLPASSPI